MNATASRAAVHRYLDPYRRFERAFLEQTRTLYHPLLLGLGL
jgi:hypothetical protein